jgi:two-component system KDP operon response regulator KdpE
MTRIGGTTGPATILLVEDEELNRVLVRAILARAVDPRLQAARLLEAETLQAARSVLAEHRVEMLLLDVRLPDGSGLELARELKTGKPDSCPAIIAITASVLPEQREAALAAGCDAILGKPFSFSALLDMISGYLWPDPAPTPSA